MCLLLFSRWMLMLRRSYRFNDVVEAVKLFESGAGMRAAVEPDEKTITLVAVLRRATTANPRERGSSARSSMDISGLLSSAQQSGDQW